MCQLEFGGLANLDSSRIWSHYSAFSAFSALFKSKTKLSHVCTYRQNGSNLIKRLATLDIESRSSKGFLVICLQVNRLSAVSLILVGLL